MEQNLDMEIIDVLLNKNLHVRGIAKEIGINHMTVLRRLNELLEENVLDCQRVGRNKMYSLKKTAEARSRIYMTEIYKLNKILERHPQLRKVINAIQNDPEIKLAVIFGSCARDDAGKDSDIDLFVETNDREKKKLLENLNSRLSVKIGEYQSENLLAKEIQKYHVIIKGVEKFYEKNTFFG